MMSKKIFIIVAALFGMIQTGLASEGGGFPNLPFTAMIHDQESLQRGAKYYMNYCAGCHSLSFQRYNRTFKDLGIDPEIGEENLIFTGAKPVEQMHNALDKVQAEKWFGQAPPDLSLTARAKGGSYVYNYLLAFYVDDSRPLGFNNAVFPGASMPNPLWQLQGLQKPIFEKHESCENGKCETHEVLSGFELITKGQESESGYRQISYDISNFLTYVADPSALARAKIGPWALLFIALLTVLFYFLKREFWRDVH